MLFLTPCFRIRDFHHNYAFFKGDLTTLQRRGSTEPNSLRYDPSKLALHLGVMGSLKLYFMGIFGDKFCQRATKQPISHRGPWGAQTGPGTLGRQLITIIMNYNQPWTTLGLAPQPQRENCDPNGSQGSANFHCIMVPGSPWSALRSLLRLQSAILTSTSDARDFVEGPKHRGSVSGSKTWTK